MKNLIGTCSFCKATFGKKAMAKHLQHCQKKETTNHSGEEKNRIFTLLVQGRYQPEYWVYLDAQGNATLKELDAFLRKTWLECCGHLSAFSIQGKRYVSYTEEPYENEKRMNIALEAVIAPKTKFFHEYDLDCTPKMYH